MNRTLACALLLLCSAALFFGCVQLAPDDDYRPLAAAVLAVQEASNPTALILPSPTPTPAHPLLCSNCNGTGRLGDGRVMVPCPICEGRGTVGAAQRPKTSLPIAEVNTVDTISRPPRVQCLVFLCDACPPCHALWDEIEQKLPAAGWKVGESADCVIRAVRQESDPDDLTGRYRVRTFPTLVLLVDGCEVRRIVGRISAVELSHRLAVLQKSGR